MGYLREIYIFKRLEILVSIRNILTMLIMLSFIESALAKFPVRHSYIILWWEAEELTFLITNNVCFFGDTNLQIYSCKKFLKLSNII